MTRRMKWNLVSLLVLATGVFLTAVGLGTEQLAPELKLEIKHSRYAYPDKIKVNRSAEGLEVIGVVKQLRPSRLPIGGYVLVQLLDQENRVLVENRGTLISASKEIARTQGLEFSVTFSDPPSQIHTVRVQHMTR